MSTPPEWQRLADLLVSRRTQLGYRQRNQFAKAHGLKHDRLLFDLENAKRTNFEQGTLAQFEQLYQWAPGSIQAVLDGGDPTPADRSSRAGRMRHIEDFTSEELLWELGRRVKLTDERLLGIVANLSTSAVRNVRVSYDEDAEAVETPEPTQPEQTRTPGVIPSRPQTES